MDSSYEFGRRVAPSEAHTYVEDYKALRGTLITDVLPWVPNYAPQHVKDSVTFHKSKVNAFIFDAALIKSLFEGPDAAQYFGVFLGAIGGNPTVVAMGLKEGTQPNTLVARAADDDIEHPRILVDAKYPGNGNEPITVEQ